MSKRKQPIFIENLHGYTIQVVRCVPPGSRLPSWRGQIYVMVFSDHGEGVCFKAWTVDHAIHLGREYIRDLRAHLMPFYPERIK